MMMYSNTLKLTYNDCVCPDEDVYFVIAHANNAYTLGPCLNCFVEYNNLSRASTPEMK